MKNMVDKNDFLFIKYINGEYSQNYVSFSVGKEKKIMAISEDDISKLRQFAKYEGINFKKDN